MLWIKRAARTQRATSRAAYPWDDSRRPMISHLQSHFLPTISRADSLTGTASRSMVAGPLMGVGIRCAGAVALQVIKLAPKADRINFGTLVLSGTAGQLSSGGKPIQPPRFAR